jgi:hypothetical protein
MVAMTTGTEISKKQDRVHRFDAHETVRIQALEGLPLASFRRRAAAWWVDAFVALLAFVPVEWVRQYLELKAAHKSGDISINWDPRKLEDLLYLIVYVALAVWLTNGRTLGKWLLGIRIVSLKSERVTLWQSAERAIGYGASFLEAGFGFLQYFIHPNRQCVHDRIAETIVVREKK